MVPSCPKRQYFVERGRVDVPYINNDDLAEAIALFRKGSPLFLEFLEQHKEICRAFSEITSVSSLGEMTDRTHYSQFASVVFYSGNLSYLRYLLIVLKFPELRALQRPRPSRGILDLINKAKMPLFYVTEKTPEIGKIPLPLNGRKIAHYTAFTCNSSTLFVGYSTGEISMFSLPLNEKDEPVSIYSKFLVDRPYSLCWTKNTLWIFTDTNVLFADLSSFTVNVLPKKVPDLKFPVVTDGHNLYSLSFGLLRFRFVHIFSLSQQNFVLERKVKLDEYGFDRQIPFMSNGTFMTFSEWEGNSCHYRQFSLVTGELIQDVHCQMDDTPYCWCYSPYTSNYFCITRWSIREYEGGTILPNWYIGVPVPDFKEVVTPLQAMYYCVYHNITIPHDDALEYLIDTLKGFIANKNVLGIITISSMLLASRYPVLIEIFEGSCVYETAPNGLKRFLVFCYLSSLRFTDNVVSNDNMVSNFLESEWAPDLVWLFPDMFDFKRIYLSKDAIVRLVTYVSELCFAFPVESRFILESFLNYAFENARDRFHDFASSVAAILILIQQKFIAVQGHHNKERRFVAESPEFLIWNRFLVCIYKTQRYWPLFADQLIRFLHFGLWNRTPSLHEELSLFLNLTLFVFLGLFRALPFVRNPSLNYDVDSFYKQHPHPLNGRDRATDGRILEVVKKCYDIVDHDMFAYTFFRLRNLLLTQDGDIANRFSKLAEQASFSASAALCFLTEGVCDKFVDVVDNGVVTWFLQLFDGKTFNSSQEIIMSMFLGDIHRARHMFANAKAHVLRTFLTDFKYPFLFPPEILAKSKVSIDAAEIVEYPLEIIELCFDNICRCSANVVDASQLFVPLIEPFATNNTSNFTEFVEPNIEPIHFHRALCWCLGFKCHEILDVSRYESTLVRYVQTGSPRLARTILLSLETLSASHAVSFKPLLRELLGVVGDFLFTLNNPLCFGKNRKVFDVAECIFTMITSFRRMVASKSFRDFLTEYIDLENPVTMVVVMALLNNSIDVFRPGVRAYAVDNYGASYEGEIQEISSRVMTINGQNISPSQCRDLWVIPNVVDLGLFEDYSVFVSMFEKCSFQERYQQVFFEASLNAFLKVPRFVAAMSASLMATIVSFACDAAVLPPVALYDFSYFLSIAYLKLPRFDIWDIQEESLTADGEDANGVVTGFLFSTHEPKQFSTCPINPLSYAKIVFDASSYMSVDLFYITGNRDMKFAVDNISSDRGGQVIIEIIPSKRVLRWTCDSRTNEAPIFPSCKMIYLILHIAYASVVSYRFESSLSFDLPFDVEPVSQSHLNLTTDRDFIPSIDSGWFNKVSLDCISNRIVDWIRWMNKIEILMKMNKPLPNPLHLLFLTNQNPPEDSLFFSDMTYSTVWMMDCRAVREYILKSAPNIESLEAELINTVANTQLVDSRNLSAISLRPGVCATLRNCFLLDETTVRVIGWEQESIETQKDSVVLPLSDVCYSILETKINVRHFLAICQRQNRQLQPELKAMIANHPVLKSLLDLIEMPEKFPISRRFGRQDLETWNSFHSCQVLLCDPHERMDLLPLTAVFSSETVKFISEHIEKSDIERYTRFLDVWDRPIEWIVSVCKSEKPTVERIAFLMQYQLCLFDKVDPFFLHIVPAFVKLTETLKRIREHPEILLFTRNCRDDTRTMLITFIKESPMITLLILIDLVCGFSENPRVIVVDVNTQDHVVFFKTESLLILGRFTKQEEFNARMLAAINDSYVCE